MNQKIDTKLGTIIIVIIAITVGLFVWKYEKNNDFNVSQTTEMIIQKKQEEQNQTQQTEEQQITEWKKYQNKDLGLAFDYPTSWGEIIIENGNRISIDIPPCKAPLMMLYARKPYPWGLYNTALKFSNAPIDLKIMITKLNAPDNPRRVCNIKGEAVVISTIQPNAQDNNITLTSKFGVTFISEFSVLTSINTSLEGPTYMARYNNKLIWISANFIPNSGTPEEIELRNYSCKKGTAYDTENGCGIIAWYQNGKTSEKVRVAFENLKELVQTFALNPQLK